jgi:hypothetical protein
MRRVAELVWLGIICPRVITIGSVSIAGWQCGKLRRPRILPSVLDAGRIAIVSVTQLRFPGSRIARAGENSNSVAARDIWLRLTVLLFIAFARLIERGVSRP